MNAYEMTFIVRPDLDEDGTRAVIEGVTGRIEAAGGELIAALSWNPPRRRMAYPIKDFGDGYYVTTVFRTDPAQLPPLENALKLNERILRFLLVQATELNITQAQQRLAQQQAATRPPAPEAAPAAAVATETAAAPAPTPEAEAAPAEPVGATTAQSPATSPEE